jgi:hypothetical protein
MLLVTSHSSRFNVNICAGIVGDFVIGPYVIHDRFGGAHYADFH